MNISTYKDNLTKKLTNYFNIKYNSSILSNTLDLFAESKLILGRTMISKRDIIDKFESNEYILVKYYDYLTDDTINDFIEYIKTTPSYLVKPNIQHKSSYINALMVCNNLPNQSNINKIKSFKYEKIYNFYFHGFCEIRLFIVGLNNNLVISNKAGKRFKKVYLPTP